MDYIRSNKLIVSTIAIQLIALPLILLLVKQNQDTRTRAEQSSSLYFNPPSSTASPITVDPGEKFSLDVMLNPGNNLISLAKIEIIYDPAVTDIDLTINNPVVVNSQAFPVIVEGPVLSNGKVQIVVSVGADQTKVI